MQLILGECLNYGRVVVHSSRKLTNYDKEKYNFAINECKCIPIGSVQFRRHPRTTIKIPSKKLQGPQSNVPVFGSSSVRNYRS